MSRSRCDRDGQTHNSSNLSTIAIKSKLFSANAPNLLPFAELLGRFGLLLAQQFQLLHLATQLDVGRLQGRVSRHVQLGAPLQSLSTHTARHPRRKCRKRHRKKHNKLNHSIVFTPSGKHRQGVMVWRRGKDTKPRLVVLLLSFVPLLLQFLICTLSHHHHQQLSAVLLLLLKSGCTKLSRSTAAGPVLSCLCVTRQVGGRQHCTAPAKRKRRRTRKGKNQYGPLPAECGPAQKQQSRTGRLRPFSRVGSQPPCAPKAAGPGCHSRSS